MTHDPLDTVIGAGEAPVRDMQTAARHRAAANAREQEGDREGTIAELRRAVAADPEDPALLFDLAYRLDMLGEEDEAIALYERAGGQTPASVNALINLAVLYEDREDYSHAERCLRQVLETDPTHERARLFMKDVEASRDMVVEEEPDRDITKRKALLEMPVTDFDLSVRARTCLKKMNVRTLGDLLRISESELMSYKNFGESSVQEIKRMLETKNLRLGQGLDDAHRGSRRSNSDAGRGAGKEAMLAKPVSDLQLSVRARKALQLLNIETIGDLTGRTEAELMGVKNFGATSLVEVKNRLAEHGLALRSLDEDQFEEE